jgi:hypothetical protein
MKPNNENKMKAAADPRSFGDLCVVAYRKFQAQIERTKANILAEFRERLEEHEHLLDLALNEAEALARQTDFPQLLFPTLAVEKVQAVARWHERQQSLRSHGSPLLLAA